MGFPKTLSQGSWEFASKWLVTLLSSKVHLGHTQSVLVELHPTNAKLELALPTYAMFWNSILQRDLKHSTYFYCKSNYQERCYCKVKTRWWWYHSLDTSINLTPGATTVSNLCVTFSHVHSTNGNKSWQVAENNIIASYNWIWMLLPAGGICNPILTRNALRPKLLKEMSFVIFIQIKAEIDCWSPFQISTGIKMVASKSCATALSLPQFHFIIDIYIWKRGCKLLYRGVMTSLLFIWRWRYSIKWACCAFLDSKSIISLMWTTYARFGAIWHSKLVCRNLDSYLCKLMTTF